MGLQTCVCSRVCVGGGAQRGCNVKLIYCKLQGITAAAVISNCFTTLLTTVFMCLCWLFIAGQSLKKKINSHEIVSPDIKLTKVGVRPQLREPGGFFVWVLWVVLKVVHGDMALNTFWCLLFLGGLLGLLCCFSSLSAGGWVALRRVYQGSLLQPWKVWGIWSVTLCYCFIRRRPHVEKNKFLVSVLCVREKKKTALQDLILVFYFASKWYYQFCLSMKSNPSNFVCGDKLKNE